MYLSDVVRKCWAGEIESAEEIVGAVRKTVMAMGVVLGGDDEVVDLSLDGLTVKPDAGADKCD
jgi:hypothetical protein